MLHLFSIKASQVCLYSSYNQIKSCGMSWLCFKAVSPFPHHHPDEFERGIEIETSSSSSPSSSQPPPPSSSSPSSSTTTEEICYHVIRRKLDECNNRVIEIKPPRGSSITLIHTPKSRKDNQERITKQHNRICLKLWLTRYQEKMNQGENYSISIRLLQNIKSLILTPTTSWICIMQFLLQLQP